MNKPETFPEFWSSTGTFWLNKGANAEEISQIAWHAAQCSLLQAQLNSLVSSRNTENVDAKS